MWRSLVCYYLRIERGAHAKVWPSLARKNAYDVYERDSNYLVIVTVYKYSVVTTSDYKPIIISRRK